MKYTAEIIHKIAYRVAREIVSYHGKVDSKDVDRQYKVLGKIINLKYYYPASNIEGRFFKDVRQNFFGVIDSELDSFSRYDTFNRARGNFLKHPGQIKIVQKDGEQNFLGEVEIAFPYRQDAENMERILTHHNYNLV